MSLKPYLKKLIYTLRLSEWMDTFLYRLSSLRNRRSNTLYKKQHPEIFFPPDILLFETFQLNYQKFMQDGQLAAKEIYEWTSPYLTTTSPTLLDWGCGVGRIIRHFPTLWPNATLYGCDINDVMIDWNRKNYLPTQFTTIGYYPPMKFESSFFDIIVGMSILTHIESKDQIEWLVELHRVTKDDGVLILSTQGKNYEKKLTGREKKVLQNAGIYTQTHILKGHRLMSTYHTTPHFTKMLAPYFTMLEMYDGDIYPHKIGGQDLWILKKKKKK